jgi:hypothetical protein
MTLKAMTASLTKILSRPGVYELLERSEVQAAMAAETRGRDLLGGAFDPDFLIPVPDDVIVLERGRFNSYCFYRPETRR